MSAEFKYEIFKDRVGDNISFYGNIDSHTEQHFEELVQRITGKNVVLDFSNTVRINSMGIAILLRSIKSIKTEKRSEVAVFGESKTNALLFKITGLYTLTTPHL
ncbi:MAG: STAS domain-containing protein [Desulfuromonadaceae bacterium]|nr:STAS domain-containing protein [Desulfuromonadaceae bacterium]